MMRMGQFSRNGDGFAGHIETLSLFRTIVIDAAEPSDAERAPDYRVFARRADADDPGLEVGVGWKRSGERAGDYVALLILDPFLPQPIRANLFREDGVSDAWSLHWSRRRDRGEKG